MDLFRNQLRTGLKWSFLGQGSSQILSLAISVGMARLILPETFGKIAMVNVIIGFSSIFVDLGFGAAIIQKKNIDNQLLSSVFWINLLIGFMLFVALFSLSNVVADFYGTPELSNISKVMSLLFVINAAATVPGNILSKAMKFKVLAFSSAMSVLVGGSVGLTLAYHGYGVEAIMSHLLIQRLVSAIILNLKCGWKPSFYFSLSKLKEISAFSTNVLANDTLNYWVRNVDTLLIGRYLDSKSLGLYNKSYSFLTLPLGTISGSISRVLFPSLSSIQDDLEKVRATYLKIIGSIAIVVFPMMIGLFVVADKFVLVVLGENWVEAVPIIRVFSILAMNQSIGTLISNLYLSQGRSDLMLKVTTPLRVLLISSIVIGLNWGIVGVAISYTLAGFMSSCINHFYAGRLVKLKLYHFLNSLSPPFFVSLSMGLIVLFSSYLLPVNLSPVWFLTLQVLVGIISFISLCEILKLRQYLFLKNNLMNYASKKN
ncbi:MAG: MOP flippase family protein [Cyclobacteriaceae bacterium]